MLALRASLSVQDALGNITKFAYDAMNRLTAIQYPDSTTTKFAYDTRGRRISVTDQNGKTTHYTYDDADRLTSVQKAAGNFTYCVYDTDLLPTIRTKVSLISHTNLTRVSVCHPCREIWPEADEMRLHHCWNFSARNEGPLRGQ